MSGMKFNGLRIYGGGQPTMTLRDHNDGSIEVETHEPMAGATTNVFFTPTKARRIAIELIRLADKMDAEEPTP